MGNHLSSDEKHHLEDQFLEKFFDETFLDKRFTQFLTHQSRKSKSPRLFLNQQITYPSLDGILATSWANLGADESAPVSNPSFVAISESLGSLFHENSSLQVFSKIEKLILLFRWSHLRRQHREPELSPVTSSPTSSLNFGSPNPPLRTNPLSDFSLPAASDSDDQPLPPPSWAQLLLQENANSEFLPFLANIFSNASEESGLSERLLENLLTAHSNPDGRPLFSYLPNPGAAPVGRRSSLSRSNAGSTSSQPPRELVPQTDHPVELPLVSRLLKLFPADLAAEPLLRDALREHGYLSPADASSAGQPSQAPPPELLSQVIAMLLSSRQLRHTLLAIWLVLRLQTPNKHAKHASRKHKRSHARSVELNSSSSSSSTPSHAVHSASSLLRRNSKSQEDVTQVIANPPPPPPTHPSHLLVEPSPEPLSSTPTRRHSKKHLKKGSSTSSSSSSTSTSSPPPILSIPQLVPLCHRLGFSYYDDDTVPPQPVSAAEEEISSENICKIDNLLSISGMPPESCQLALELNSWDENTSMNWLFDNMDRLETLLEEKRLRKQSEQEAKLNESRAREMLRRRLENQNASSSLRRLLPGLKSRDALPLAAHLEGQPLLTSPTSSEEIIAPSSSSSSGASVVELDELLGFVTLQLERLVTEKINMHNIDTCCDPALRDRAVSDHHAITIPLLCSILNRLATVEHNSDEQNYCALILLPLLESHLDPSLPVPLLASASALIRQILSMYAAHASSDASSGASDLKHSKFRKKKNRSKEKRSSSKQGSAIRLSEGDGSSTPTPNNNTSSESYPSQAASVPQLFHHFSLKIWHHAFPIFFPDLPSRIDLLRELIATSSPLLSFTTPILASSSLIEELLPASGAGFADESIKSFLILLSPSSASALLPLSRKVLSVLFVRLNARSQTTTIQSEPLLDLLIWYYHYLADQSLKLLSDSHQSDDQSELFSSALPLCLLGFALSENYVVLHQVACRLLEPLLTLHRHYFHRWVKDISTSASATATTASPRNKRGASLTSLSDLMGLLTHLIARLAAALMQLSPFMESPQTRNALLNPLFCFGLASLKPKTSGEETSAMSDRFINRCASDQLVVHPTLLSPHHRQFLEDIIEECGEGRKFLASFEQLVKPFPGQDSETKKCLRIILAAYLKHSQHLDDAIALTTDEKSPSWLRPLYLFLNGVYMSILQKKQRLMQMGSAVEPSELTSTACASFIARAQLILDLHMIPVLPYDAQQAQVHSSDRIPAPSKTDHLSKFIRDDTLDAAVFRECLEERKNSTLLRLRGLRAFEQLLDALDLDKYNSDIRLLGIANHALRFLPVLHRCLPSYPTHYLASTAGTSLDTLTKFCAANCRLYSTTCSWLIRLQKYAKQPVVLSAYFSLLEGLSQQFHLSEQEYLHSTNILAELETLASPLMLLPKNARPAECIFFSTGVSTSRSFNLPRVLQQAALLVSRFLISQLAAAPALTASLPPVFSACSPTPLILSVLERTVSQLEQLRTRPSSRSSPCATATSELRTLIHDGQNCMQLLDQPQHFSSAQPSCRGLSHVPVVGESDSFSLSLWVTLDRPRHEARGTRALVIRNCLRPLTLDFAWVLNVSAKRLEFWIQLQSSTEKIHGPVLEGLPYTFNKRMFLVVTCADNTVNIYVDGALFTSKKIAARKQTLASHPVYFGQPRHLSATTGTFDGMIADCRLSSRAYPPAEVKLMYEVTYDLSISLGSEEYLFALLSNLRQLLHAPDPSMSFRTTLCAHLTSPAAFSLLFATLSDSSLRCQRELLHILSSVLSHSPISSATETHLEQLFSSLGPLSFSTSLSSDSNHLVATSAHHAQALAAELVDFFRRLLRESTSCATFLHTLVSKYFDRSQAIVEPLLTILNASSSTSSSSPSSSSSSSSPSPSTRASTLSRSRQEIETPPRSLGFPALVQEDCFGLLSALILIGGHSEIIRPGSVVHRLRQDAEQPRYTVVEYEPTWEFCLLQPATPTDGPSSRTISLELTEVAPVIQPPALSISIETFHLRILPLLVTVLSRTTGAGYLHFMDLPSLSDSHLFVFDLRSRLLSLTHHYLTNGAYQLSNDTLRELLNLALTPVSVECPLLPISLTPSSNMLNLLQQIQEAQFLLAHRRQILTALHPLQPEFPFNLESHITPPLKMARERLETVLVEDQKIPSSLAHRALEINGWNLASASLWIQENLSSLKNSTKESKSERTLCNKLSLLTGFSNDLCTKALKVSGQLADEALRWLMSAAAIPSFEASQKSSSSGSLSDFLGLSDADDSLLSMLNDTQCGDLFNERFFDQRWSPSFQPPLDLGTPGWLNIFAPASRPHAGSSFLPCAYKLAAHQHLTQAIFELQRIFAVRLARASLLAFFWARPSAALHLDVNSFLALLMAQAPGDGPNAALLRKIFAITPSHHHSRDFFSQLLQACGQHLARAASPEYASVLWNKRTLSTKEYQLISRPAVELVQPILGLLLAARPCLLGDQSLMVGFAEDLLEALQTPNMGLRDIVFCLLAHLMVHPKSTAIFHSGAAKSLESFLSNPIFLQYVKNLIDQDRSTGKPNSLYVIHMLGLIASIKLPSITYKSNTSGSASPLPFSSSPSSSSSLGLIKRKSKLPAFTRSMGPSSSSSSASDRSATQLRFDPAYTNKGLTRTDTLLENQKASCGVSLGDVTFTQIGIYYWEVRLVNFVEPGSIMLAVTSEPSSSVSLTRPTGKGFMNYRALMIDGNEQMYGQDVVPGDTIGMLLDLTRGTMTYYKNGQSMGRAFANLRPPLTPLFALRGRGSAILLQSFFCIETPSSQHLLETLLPMQLKFLLDLSSSQSAVGASPDVQPTTTASSPAPPSSSHASPESPAVSVPLAIHDKSFLHDLHTLYTEWGQHLFWIHKVRGGTESRFDTRGVDSHPVNNAGYAAGDVLVTHSDQKYMIVGVFDGHLWVQRIGDRDEAFFFQDPEFAAEFVNARIVSRRDPSPPLPLLTFEQFEARLNHHDWTVALENLLLRTLNDMAFRLGIHPQNISHVQLRQELQRQLIDGNQLKFMVEVGFPRLALYFWLNSMAATILPYLSFSPQSFSTSMGALLIRCRESIFTHYKHQFLNELVVQTASPSVPAEDPYDDPRYFPKITLNRKLASGATTDQPESSLFFQMLKQTKNWRPQQYRQEWVGILDAGQKRAFRVVFTGEGCNDNGGPYREVFSELCSELQGVLPFFSRSVNFKNNVGESMNRWVVAPDLTLSACDQFVFIGKIMGMALRSGLCLHFDWATTIWKRLVGGTPDIADLFQVNHSLAKLLQDISACADQMTFEGCFADLSWDLSTLDLPALLSPPSNPPLHLDGPLQFADKDAYVETVLQRALEYELPFVEALKRGLAAVLPVELFSLFTAVELEQRVCGLADFSVDLLEAHTIYEEVDPSEPHISYFWEVLRNRFNAQDRSNFLQFVWARSRAPASSEGWDMPFKIQPGPRSHLPPDDQLCYSHSCFFSLSLPRYSFVDILEKKLRISISCKEMDLDVRLTADQVWQD